MRLVSHHLHNIYLEEKEKHFEELEIDTTKGQTTVIWTSQDKA